MIRLKAKELRTTKATEEHRLQIRRNPIYIVLDNVLDTYNVGAIFRLADAVAAEKVILCGATEIPPHTRIKKASINTTEWVPWEYAESAKAAVSNLKSQMPNVKIYAIEQSSKSVLYDKVQYLFPATLVVGHETTGVSEEVLEIVDQIVEIPMWGINTSLNVMVSLGIVLFEAMKHKKN